jgi:hypothetical protein
LTGVATIEPLLIVKFFILCLYCATRKLSMEIYFLIITDNSYLNGQVGVERR